MIDYNLLISAALGVALLLYLVLVLRLSAFIALLLVSMGVGLSSGMQPEAILTTIKNGMGGTLGFVAIVVGLGAILGEILEKSGGIEQIARTLIKAFGEDKIQWSLGIAGFLVAIPVFFDVAFIILAPLIYGLAKKSGKSLLFYAIPLLAGLAITHSFIPPTPGPIAVAELVQAELGWVILFGAIVGIPAMICAGPLFGRYISERFFVAVPESHRHVTTPDAMNFGWALAIVLLPLILIMSSTLSPYVFDQDSDIVKILSFIGHPFVALILATLFAMLVANIKCHFDKQSLLALANKGLEPAGVIILITGAGGAFKQTLVDSGVGKMLAELFLQANVPLLLLGFILAAITRIAQGSATVAMITAAGLLAPFLELNPQSAPMLGLLVIAISSGATILSHVNDSGFWLVSRYLGIDEKTTLASWTLMTCIVSIVGLLCSILLSMFFV